MKKEANNPWVNRDFADENPESVELDQDVDQEIAEEEAVLTGIELELEEMKAKVLRAHAEMENVRRRADQDKSNARKFAIEGVLTDLVPILDSLDQALQSAPADDPMAAGVKMIQALFGDVLTKHGVKVINPEQEKFNPQLHEAVTMQPVEGAQPNTVVNVLQKGYSLNDRLVRPARVVVAK